MPTPDLEQPDGLDGPHEPSQLEIIGHRVQSLEARVRVISAGQAHLVDQIAEIAVSQRAAEEHRRLQAQRMDELQAAMEGNTTMTKRTLEATEAVRDLVTTARTGGKVVRWLAPTLVAVGIAVGTVKGWWIAGMDLFHHTQPPGK